MTTDAHPSPRPGSARKFLTGDERRESRPDRFEKERLRFRGGMEPIGLERVTVERNGRQKERNETGDPFFRCQFRKGRGERFAVVGAKVWRDLHANEYHLRASTVRCVDHRSQVFPHRRE